MQNIIYIFIWRERMSRPRPDLGWTGVVVGRPAERQSERAKGCLCVREKEQEERVREARR
eukprot:6212071-Pleurochrysis_carterae.AAC.2